MGRAKPSGALADLATTKKHPTTILGDIQAHLLKEHHKPTDRRQDILHPSEMAKSDWCPRQSYYRLAGTTPSNPDAKKFSSQLETIFAEGHEIHRKWQQWLRDMGELWGKWKCGFCEHTWMDTSPVLCPNCKSPNNVQYREVPLEAEEKYLIAGHEDGAVRDALVEIKSIGIGTLRFEEPALLRKYQVETVDGKKIYDLDALWAGIRRPLSSHIRQTAIYGALAHEMGYDWLDKVVFLYEFKANQAVKEFTVKINPDIAAPLLDQALDVKYALSKGKPVPRPPHADSPAAKVCKECPFRSLCWELDDQGSTPGEENTPSAGGTDDVELGPGDVVRPSSRGARGRRSVPAPAPRGRGAEPARRPDRLRRRVADAPVQPAHDVGGVHGGEARSSGGGREIRRRRPGPA